MPTSANGCERSLERIAAAHPDELVVVVVHGGVIGQVMNIATGSTGFAFTGSDNASISHLVLADGRWIVRCFNDTSHLRSTFSTAGEAAAAHRHPPQRRHVLIA